MTEHYFSANTDGYHDLGAIHDVQVSARGRLLQLKASDRVFSQDGLDLGTAQLLAKAPVLPPEGTFLDLGCGWGPVAIAMALDSPSATVWAVDVNQRALALTEINAALAGTTNVVPMDADEALARASQQNVRFDVIWSNPPIRVGKTALRQMLLTWLALLSPEGRAYLVVNRNLGADSLGRWLETQGYAVTRIASRKGFRILEVVAA